MERRKLLLLGTVSVAALVGAGLGGATQCSAVDVVNTVAQFIEAVQTKVRDTMATACGLAQKYIVVPDTILAIAAKILGETVVVANLGKAVANIQTIIDAIVATGCPPAPAPAPTAVINGKPTSIVVRFY